MFKFIEFLRNTKLIGSKITAVGAVAFGVYLITQGDVATGVATIAGGWAALIGSSIAGKIETKVETVSAKVETVAAKVDSVAERVEIVQASTEATAVVVGAAPAPPVPVTQSPEVELPSKRFEQKFIGVMLAVVTAGLLQTGLLRADERERVQVAIAFAGALQEARTAVVTAAVDAQATYCDARAEAEKLKKPLIVFVGQSSRLIAGAVVASVPDFAGVTGKAVVIGTPSDGKILRYLDISGQPTNAEIGRHLNEVCKDGVCSAPSRVKLPNGTFFQYNECPTCPKR